MPKSTAPQVKIVNVETGEEIVRDANAEELAQIEFSKAKAQAVQAEEQTKATTRQAILDRLGLTADELKTILG